MTKEELYDICDLIEKEITKEKELARRYIMRNPTDAKNRCAIRDHIIYGLNSARLTIRENCKID